MCRPESVDLWEFLSNYGANTQYTREVQQHPSPFPSQKVTPFIGFLMSLAKNQDIESGDETETALNKVQMLLKAGRNQFIGFHRESAREHGWGTPTPHPRSLGRAACYLLVMLTCAPLMTPSHSEGRCQSK